MNGKKNSVKLQGSEVSSGMCVNGLLLTNHYREKSVKGVIITANVCEC